MRSPRPSSSCRRTRSRASRSRTAHTLCSGTVAKGSGRGRTGGIEPPLARYALQLAHSLVLELDPRACDEVFDRPGDKDLAGAGSSGDASSNVDGDPRHLAVLQLALARVDAGADREVE